MCYKLNNTRGYNRKLFQMAAIFIYVIRFFVNFNRVLVQMCYESLFRSSEGVKRKYPAEKGD